MALEQTELVQTSGSDIFPIFEKVSMNDHITAIFGASAGAETLARCAPVGYNDSTEFYGAWVAPDPTVIVMTVDGTIVVDGTATGSIDVSAATEASVTALLLAIGVQATVAEATDVFTITLDGDPQVAVTPTVTAAGNTVTDGTSTFGMHVIRGFIWPDEAVLSATLQVHGEVMVAGRIPYAAIAATVDSGDVTALQAELKSTQLARSIIVEDLPNIH